MGTSYARENATDIWDEAHALMVSHAEEVGIFGTERWAPKLDAYRRLEDAGVLRCFTLRHGENGRTGQLDGYALFHVMPHLHYDLTIAMQDAMFVRRECRGIAGAKFIAWTDARLKADGVGMVFRESIVTCDYSRTLTRMGYTLTGHVHRKEL